MSNTPLTLNDFGTEVEHIIKSDISARTGLQKSIAVVVSFSSNQVCYKVGTTEKAVLKKDLQSAIDEYNNL